MTLQMLRRQLSAAALPILRSQRGSRRRGLLSSCAFFKTPGKPLDAIPGDLVAAARPDEIVALLAQSRQHRARRMGQPSSRFHQCRKAGPVPPQQQADDNRLFGVRPGVTARRQRLNP